MKKINFFKLVFTIIICLPLVDVWAQNTSTNSTVDRSAGGKVYAFTLDEAMVFAEQKRPDLKNQHLNIQIGQAQLNQSKTFFFPKINGTIDSRLNTRLQTSVLPAEVFGGQAGTFREIQFGTRYNTLSSVDLNAVLWDDAASTDVKIAKNKLESNKVQLNKSFTTVKLNIAQAYYLVLINNERTKLSVTELARALRYLDEGKQKKNNGTIASADIDDLELAASRAKSENDRSYNDFLLSKEFLLNQLGLSANNEIQLKDSLVLVNTSNKIDEFNSDSVADAFKSRPEYKLEQLNLSLAQLNLLRAKKDKLPKLSFYGIIAAQAMTANLNILDFNKQWYPYNYVGLKLSIPIFDGLQSKYKKQEYKLQEEISRNELDDQQLNLTYEYHSALNAVKFNSNNVQNEFMNLENAKRSVKVSELRFKEGIVYLSQLLNAERALMDTQNTFIRSIYDYYIAQLNLKKALGIL